MRSPLNLVAAAWFAASLATGCGATTPGASGEPPAPSPPSGLCGDPTLSDDAICVPGPSRVDALLESPMRVVEIRPASAGTSKVFMMWVAWEVAPTPVVAKTKWKPTLDSGDGLNNSPRRQLAAYQIQGLFLEPDHYVVPPGILRCLPVSTLQAFYASAAPTFDDTTCQLGMISFWVHGLSGGDPAEDFDATHAGMAEALSALNLFTYLIDHRDSRSANFLVAHDPVSPRFFAIDNDLAFSGFVNPVSLVDTDWSELFVERVSAAHVARLRALDEAALSARLSVVAELEMRGDGSVVSVEPGPLIGEPHQGVRFEGTRIQFGLTTDEIESIAERIEALLEDVDSGELETF